MNFDTGMKSTWKTKSRGGETIFQGSTEMITEEDRQKFFAENPHAAQLVQLKDQAELDSLGASISASAKMNGGGLVQGLRGGGLVLNLGQTPMAQMSELREERKEIYRRQVNGKMSKEDRKKLRKVNAQINELGKKIKESQGSTSIKKNNLQVSNEQKKIATPGSITKKPKVTVAYQNELNNSGSSNTPAGGNKKIPTFSAVKMRSGDKIRVLGISV
jgi:TolA-binding protein